METKMLNPRSIAALAAAVAAGLLGCQMSASTRGVKTTSEDGIAAQYERYTGPLHAKRYQTMEQITFTEQGGDYDPAVSPDGTKLIYSSTVQSEVPDIYMKSIGEKANAATRVQLTNSNYAEIQPCFSPDGKSFAYATNRRGNWDICIESLGGGNPRHVTESMKTDEISPCWHPGGEWIAFSTFNPRTLRWELAAKSLKTGQLRRFGEGLFPKFSPDGRRIVFQRPRDREPRWYSVWIIDVDEEFNVGLPMEVVSSAKWAAINPSWSPDGKYLTFATVHESPQAQSTRRILMGDDIWLVNLDGQDLVRLTDSPEPESHPVWAPAKGGKPGLIYFCSMQTGPKNIWALQPSMPSVYGSVSGPLPGPEPASTPEKAPKGGVEPPGSGAAGQGKTSAPANAPASSGGEEPAKVQGLPANSATE